MIDIAQLPTASSTANTAAPAAASGVASPGDGKESGFQSVIGKVMNSGDAPAESSTNAAAGVGALPGTAALFADDIAAKLQAVTPHAYESAATPLLLNTLDTAPAYQHTPFGAQPLAALSSMLQPTPSAGATPPPIGTPVQQSDWGDDLGSRITWMIKQDVTAADIKLNPPHLGPLEVKISMSQDQVSVAFTSHHAVVRDALDTALPRVREMLNDNGLQLANANVSNKSASDQGGSQHYGAGNQGGGQRGAAGNGDGEDVALAVTAALPGAGRYLVDYYA